MREVTRNLLLAILAVVVLLLALGALPSLLKSGDPYYVVASPEGAANESITTTGPNATAINASTLSERTHPFTTAALADAGPNRTGRSGAYWRGPVGVKEAFTHSPFDELASLRQRNPGATDGDAVVLVDNGTLYRVGVTQSRR